MANDTKSPVQNYADRQNDPSVPTNIAYPGVASGISKAQATNLAKANLDNNPPKKSHVTNATPTLTGDA